MTSLFTYQEFKQQVEEKRKKTAKFFRADFHVHTIGSPPSDYPCTHQKAGFVNEVPLEERDLRSRPEEFKQLFVEAAKQKHLSVVAVTDHNESDLAEELSKLSDKSLLILPGIEISIRTGLFHDSTVHILGIFPVGTLSKTIDKVFPAGCGMPVSGKRDTSSVTEASIDECIRLIKSRDLGGICIAAHVDSEKGMRTLFRMQDRKYLEARWRHRFLKEKEKKEGLTASEEATLSELDDQLTVLPDDMQNKYLQFIAEHSFDAVQVKSWETEEHYRGEHTEALDLPPFVCIVASDAHTLADVGCEGHCTHIKMAELSFEGIKKAFLDPEARIRYDANVPSQQVSRILGISFEGGVFEDEVLGFSDNLTALIGGRGTGKSAIIEAIRYLFSQSTDDLPDRLKSDIKERRDYTLQNTTVKLLFEDSGGQAYVLKRQNGDSKTSVFDLDGRPILTIDLPNSEQVRAEIYGWSEIETLSDSPSKQLKLLDRYIPEIEALKLQVDEQLAELQSNQDQMVRLAREIQNLLPSITNAEEIEGQLAKLKKPELDEAFEKHDANKTAALGLTQVTKAVEELEKTLPLQPPAETEELDTEKLKFSDGIVEAISDNASSLSTYSWWADSEKGLRQECERTDKAYLDLLQALSAMRSILDSAHAELYLEQSDIEAILNTIAESSGQKDFRTAISRRQALSQKSLQIRGYQEDIAQKVERISELLEIRQTRLIPRLYKAKEALFLARSAKAQAIAERLLTLEASSKVQIDVIQLGNRDHFVDLLAYREGTRSSGLFKNIDRQYFSKNYAGYYSIRFTPYQFVPLFLQKDADRSVLAIRYIRATEGINKGKIVHLVEGEVQTRNGYIVEMKDGKDIGQWDTTSYEFVEVLDVDKVWNHLSPWFYNNEIHDYPDPEKLSNLLDLELSSIEDRPVITLDGKPIEGLSPGQRCSALIPIVLVEGNTPLVIDQPEDNLDNELVFDLVVDILRRLKEHRQVIVATHNPNIPVSGDVEQVIVLKSPSKDRCHVATYGSIDDNGVVHHIKTVMEGGDKAFDMRMKKYGLRSGNVKTF
jgi:DNA repair ATPase RecN